MNNTSNIKKIIANLDIRTTSWFSKFGIIGAVALVTMMLITVADAFGRRFLALPVYGAYELTVLLLIIVFFASFTYCTIFKGHFVINIITSRLSGKVRCYVVTIMYLVSALICFLIAAELVIYAIKMKASNLTGTQFTYIPMYIFVLFGVLCTAISGWGFLLQFIAYLIEALDRK
jgi:TRAP-type C4-dicarboxylate transport system permease small subunit